MQVSLRTEKDDTEAGMEILELKTGEKKSVLNWACKEAEIKVNLPLMFGKMQNKRVEVLQDNGCNRVIIGY